MLCSSHQVGDYQEPEQLTIASKLTQQTPRWYGQTGLFHLDRLSDECHIGYISAHFQVARRDRGRHILRFIHLVHPVSLAGQVRLPVQKVQKYGQINQTEMGSLSQEPQHSRSSCECAQLGIQRGPVGAETYCQQEGQQDLPSSTSTYRSQEMTPDVDRFDLVSCTQYGITLHSAQNPLSPLRPQRFHIPRTAWYGVPTNISHGPATPQATCASTVEHCSSLPKLVTASSAMASPTAGEMDNDFVARPFSLVEVTQDTFFNEEKPAEEPQKPRWPFFQDKCVLEEGMLTSLFDDSSWQ